MCIQRYCCAHIRIRIYVAYTCGYRMTLWHWAKRASLLSPGNHQYLDVYIYLTVCIHMYTVIVT